MDCSEARQTLDASRPQGRDWAEPELRAAAAHVEHCPDCQSALSIRDRFDQDVACEMERIEIPDGLSDRLLAALSRDARTIAAELAPVRRRGRWTVRWWAAAAALALLAGGWWWQFPAEPTLTMEQVSAAIGRQFDQVLADAAPAFDGRFAPPLPDAVWREVVGGGTPIGIDLDGRTGHDGAVYRFTSGRLAGILVVLPRSRVGDAPVESVPRRSNARYLPHPQVAWTVGDCVYICVLQRGNLDDLQRQFYGGTV